VKFDGFSLFFLWAVFVIGSGFSIGFFRSPVLLWFETNMGFRVLVFVVGISEKWLQIRRFTFLKKWQTTTASKIVGLLFMGM
jgi:hypothetical protein